MLIRDKVDILELLLEPASCPKKIMRLKMSWIRLMLQEEESL